MRGRNKELVKNVGELSKEIEEQDLERINGGDNISETTYPITVITTISTNYPSLQISNPDKTTKTRMCSNAPISRVTVSVNCHCGKTN